MDALNDSLQMMNKEFENKLIYRGIQLTSTQTVPAGNYFFTVYLQSSDGMRVKGETWLQFE